MAAASFNLSDISLKTYQKPLETALFRAFMLYSRFPDRRRNLSGKRDFMSKIR